MKVTEFDFNLPDDLIAQQALADRAASRLLVMDKNTGAVQHSQVKNLGAFLRAGDLLVVNNSRVLPARLLGQTTDGIAAECFLLKRINNDTWEALVRPGKKINNNDKIVCEKNNSKLVVTVLEKFESGAVKLQIDATDFANVDEALQEVGHMPLPPYIKRPDVLDDKTRYQTVYAKPLGSVAAPTAGLHFTPELMKDLKAQGIEFAEITLHVGYGTFKPVRVDNVEDHVVDPEVFEISDAAAQAINTALDEGRRIIVVGTTTTRALEYCASQNNGTVVAGAGVADIFIYPDYKFKVLSGLMTNFHLPKSSLLFLVSAFGGKEQVLAAYNTAVANGYRFYSYGDAMLIL